MVPYWKETVVVSPCGLSDPLSVAEKLAINVAGLVEATGGPGRCKCGKDPVGPKAGTAIIVSDNSEMISVVSEQAGNIGTDRPHCVAILSLHRSSGSIARRKTILEGDHRGRPTRIDRTV